MRELTLTEVEAVSGGLTPGEGIAATLTLIGIAVVAGAASPVIALGFASIGAMAVIDMLHPTPGSGGRRLGSSSNLSNTKDACA